MQNVPQPLFAPASQRAEADDYDLNEIFAEYFSNEFDTDPMNAYTEGMANYTSGASGGPMGTFLPTGGIRTPFHVGSNNSNNMTGGTGIIGGGIAGSIAPPIAKKPRHDDNLSGIQQLAQQQQQLQQQPPMMQHQMNLGIGVASNNSMMMGGQQQLAQQQQPQQQQPQSQSQPQQQQQVNLPVGVGIRLGALGGIAPAGGVGALPGAAPAHFTAAAGLAAQQQLQQFLWAQQGLAGMTAGNGVESEVAVAERRQRNREHAKRSRVRKKFMLESLQEEVRQLQRENQSLRMMVQEHIPEQAMQIITECCTGNPLFDDMDLGGHEDGEDDAAGGGETGARRSDNLVKSDLTLMQSLAAGQQCFVLSDPKLPDNPIVFASPGFYKLTGYTSKEVLGRNCRFLQGAQTDKKAVDVIRKAIETGSDATVCLLNYKADGTPFWNQFFLASLRDSDNNIVNYVGVMTEVEPDAGANALEEKVNAVLPLQVKDEKDEDNDS